MNRLPAASATSLFRYGVLAGFTGRGSRSVATRNPKERRRYVGRPRAYFHDILGVSRLSPLHEELLELILDEDKILHQKANDIGGTFLWSGVCVYYFDAVAAVLDADGREQGCRILLPGPDHDTIFSTVYAEILEHADRAERRGFLMPGRRSNLSVRWMVRPKWDIQAFAPPKRSGKKQAHSASGRHHPNMVAFLEEASEVVEELWQAVDGMCSSAGNKQFAASNPTEDFGPFYERCQGSDWYIFTESALDHPNIVTRSPVIPEAISLKVTEDRIRAGCLDIGPYPENLPDAGKNDFVYALPATHDVSEPRPREDGHRGHRDAPLHVFRPTSRNNFAAKVLGRFPKGGSGGFFSAAEWEQSVGRWSTTLDPYTPPDRVGFDPAGDDENLGTADDAAVAPAWGLDAESLLRRYTGALLERDLGRVEEIQATERIYVGPLQILPPSSGDEMADELLLRFPESVWCIDPGNVGKSPYDFARLLRPDTTFAVHFGGSPVATIEGEPLTDTMRGQLYVRLKMLLERGLIDLPGDPRLRQELLALRARVATVTRYENGVAVKRDVVRFESKRKWASRIGRSPDFADAVVLSLFQPTESHWGRPGFSIGL